jgi:membrane protein
MSRWNRTLLAQEIPMQVEQITSRAGLELAVKVLVQSAIDFAHDSGTQWAAAISYYSLVSFFPLLLATAGVAAFFINPEWAVEQLTGLLGSYLPAGSIHIRRLVEETIAARGGLSLLSFGIFIWTGSRVFGAVTKGLNIAYDSDEPYNFFRRAAIEIGYTLTIGVLFILALGSRVLLGFVWSTLIPIMSRDGLLYRALQAILPAVILIVVFYLTFHFVPRRKVVRTAALAGAILAAVLFLVARPLFITYIIGFTSYSIVYAPLALVLVLVLWVWLSAVILLYAGEVVSHIQDMVIDGLSVEEVERRHLIRNPVDSRESR